MGKNLRFRQLVMGLLGISTIVVLVLLYTSYRNNFLEFVQVQQIKTTDQFTIDVENTQEDLSLEMNPEYEDTSIQEFSFSEQKLHVTISITKTPYTRKFSITTADGEEIQYLSMHDELNRECATSLGETVCVSTISIDFGIDMDAVRQAGITDETLSRELEQLVYFVLFSKLDTPSQDKTVFEQQFIDDAAHVQAMQLVNRLIIEQQPRMFNVSF